MADITVRRNHGMELDEAKDKAHDVLDDIKDDIEYIDSIDWNADGSEADVSGKGFSGTFSVDENAVVVDIKLKFLAKPFKGKIQQQVEKHVDRHFG